MFRFITRAVFHPSLVPSRLSSNAGNFITVKVIDRDAKLIETKAKIGSNMLDVILDNKIDVDGFGACEGTLACSTCHIVLDSENYKTLPEPVDEENGHVGLGLRFDAHIAAGLSNCR